MASSCGTITIEPETEPFDPSKVTGDGCTIQEQNGAPVGQVNVTNQNSQTASVSATWQTTGGTVLGTDQVTISGTSSKTLSSTLDTSTLPPGDYDVEVTTSAQQA